MEGGGKGGEREKEQVSEYMWRCQKEMYIDRQAGLSMSILFFLFIFLIKKSKGPSIIDRKPSGTAYFGRYSHFHSHDRIRSDYY